jgi:hypothetical protein
VSRAQIIDLIEARKAREAQRERAKDPGRRPLGATADLLTDEELAYLRWTMWILREDFVLDFVRLDAAGTPDDAA